MGFLIEKGSEREYVESLDGREGWTVLAEGEAARPRDHAEFDGKRWVVDEAAKAEAEKVAAILADPVGEIAKRDAQIAQLAAALGITLTTEE